ncbi:hypothetical protein V2J09_021659 [Rumex salicifolius]
MATPGTCVLLTGPPGVGKTTLIIKVLESLKSSNPSLKVQGFYTREIRHGSERVGFEVVTVGGQNAPLASINTSSPESIRWPHVGRYKVDVASFESVALPELQIKEDTNLFVIDEVGKMELYSSSFLPAVLRILDSNIPVLASIPIPKQGRDIPGVARVRNHPRAVIYTLNQSNRDTLRERIYSQLTVLISNYKAHKTQPSLMKHSETNLQRKQTNSLKSKSGKLSYNKSKGKKHKPIILSFPVVALPLLKPCLAWVSFALIYLRCEKACKLDIYKIVSVSAAKLGTEKIIGSFSKLARKSSAPTSAPGYDGDLLITPCLQQINQPRNLLKKKRERKNYNHTTRSSPSIEAHTVVSEYEFFKGD